MQIILDITQDARGRLSGTARTADDTRELTFSGTMELLARIEELCAGSLYAYRAPVSQRMYSPMRMYTTGISQWARRRTSPVTR